MIVFGSFIQEKPHKIKIGVLGGIGPESSAEFYLKLVKDLQSSGLIKSNLDYPQIIINNINPPEPKHDILPDHELEYYIKGLRELDNFGVDFIVMVCNTIHIYYEKLQKTINTPILDLREVIQEKLVGDVIKKPLIIGSKVTVKQGLYKFKGLQIFEPNEDELDNLTDAIVLFNKGQNKTAQVEKLNNICNKYIQKGADSVILGCTEFALMLDYMNFPKINTINVLGEATIKRFTKLLNNHKNKQI